MVEMLLRAIHDHATPDSAQELAQAVMEQALENFYYTLEILTDQDSYSTADIQTAKMLNAVLMPREYWMIEGRYHSEHGTQKLRYMKELLKAEIEKASKEG